MELKKVKYFVKNEKGSQAVEFMGIAAVLIIVLVIVSTQFNTNQNSWLGGLFGTLFSTLITFFTRGRVRV